MRFHWQNLNEKRGGKMGNPIRQGRAWWHLTERTCVAWEWGIRPRMEMEAAASMGGVFSHQLTLHVSLLGLFLYLGFDAPILARLYNRAQRADGVRVGVCAKWEGTPQVNIDLGSREMSWRSSDPRWRKGWRFDFADILLGGRSYAREVLKSREVVIPMPEGSYPATVELDLCTWRRPRWPWWPFTIRRYGSKVDIPGGIPFAGKGENSWDCGDDGLFGINPGVETFEDAVAETVRSVLRTRAKQGTASWLCDARPVMAQRPVASQE